MRAWFWALLCLAPSVYALPTTPFISEIHYDNSGGDRDEFVEITGSGIDLSGWTLRFYNGANGEIYDSFALGGSLAAGQLRALAFFPGFSVQNGPDGVALVDAAGSLVEFLAYEAAFAALEGEAVAQPPRLLPLAENGGTPLGYSLQRLSLTDADDWQAAIATPGQLNPGLAISSNAANPGRVGQVPVPASLWLLLAGVLRLGLHRLRWSGAGLLGVAPRADAA